MNYSMRTLEQKLSMINCSNFDAFSQWSRLVAQDAEGLRRMEFGEKAVICDTNIDFLTARALAHPMRVKEMKDAIVFIVPFSFHRSFLGRDALAFPPSTYPMHLGLPEPNATCDTEGYRTHKERMLRLVEALERNQHWRTLGPKHFFAVNTDWTWSDPKMIVSHHRMIGMTKEFRERVYSKISTGLMQDNFQAKVVRQKVGRLVFPMEDQRGFFVPSKSGGRAASLFSFGFIVITTKGREISWENDCSLAS